MSLLSEIGFDTSAINRFENDGYQSEPLIIAQKCGIHVCQPAMRADEVLSDPDPERGERLGRC
jgi:hypothetical protein